MKKSNMKQQIISFIKNHPIKILVSGTGGVSFFWGMNKIIDLNHTNILQKLSNIKNILSSNIDIVVVCICVIVIATYIFIFKIKKLKADERTNQKILQGFKDIANKNSSVNDIEIHKKDDKLSILMNIQKEEENSQPPNNMHVIKGRKEEINISKDIKSN